MKVLKELYTIIKKQYLTELKLPSKLKRLMYSIMYETQPEKIIQVVRSMSDRELMTLHQWNIREKETGAFTAKRGTPRDIQARAIAAEIKKRGLEWPTIDSSLLDESKHELTKNVKKSMPSCASTGGNKKKKFIKGRPLIRS